MANLMKPEVLQLYKRILQLGRSWNSINPCNSDEERKYIKDEARIWFKRNKHITDIQEIKDHVQEGEARLEMGELFFPVQFSTLTNDCFLSSSSLQESSPPAHQPSAQHVHIETGKEVRHRSGKAEGAVSARLHQIFRQRLRSRQRLIVKFNVQIRSC